MESGRPASLSPTQLRVQDTISIPAVAQGAPAPPELPSVNARHKAAPRHAAATNNTLHVLHTVIALVGMTVAIHTLWDN